MAPALFCFFLQSEICRSILRRVVSETNLHSRLVLRQAQDGEQVVEPPDLNMIVEIVLPASFSLGARLACAGKSRSQDF
jgi:hypothetical protein